MKSVFGQFRDWHRRNLLARVASRLDARGFDTVVYDTAAEAADHLLRTIPVPASIGIGGSVTVRELNIIQKFEQRGQVVFHHWQEKKLEGSDHELRRKEGMSDYYLTSANAITRQGDIINIDGIGNRIAHMVFGPDNVIIIAGCNKIVDDIEAGIRRTKEIAAVTNARRLGIKTPCAKTGMCTDCDAPTRICRVTSIMHYRPWQTNVTVVLVNELLGF